jgi:hypothetical protein
MDIEEIIDPGPILGPINIFAMSISPGLRALAVPVSNLINHRFLLLFLVFYLQILHCHTILPFYNSSLTSHSLHSIKIYFQMERKPHAN